MQGLLKEISNPQSTGGSGVFFESKVLAYFITIMNTGGIIPVLNGIPTQIISQASRLGYSTDDMVIIVEDSSLQKERKLVCQAKQSITVTKNDKEFSKFIHDAWIDYNNQSIFSRESDAIVLITGPLSKKDINGVLLLDRVRSTRDTDRFMTDLKKGKFTSNYVREKYDVICHHISSAKNGESPSEKEIHGFLRNIYILQFDLGSTYGMNLPLICSHLSQCCREPPKQVWDSILEYATNCMKNGSSIRKDDLPHEIRCRFSKITSIPSELQRDQEKGQFTSDNIPALTIMHLIGSWDDKKEEDIKVVRKFVERTYVGGYAVWFDEIKKIAGQEGSLVSVNDGVWTLNDRKLSTIITDNIFDDTLKAFSDLVLTITNERDPGLDLSPDKRFAAAVFGKDRKLSKILRKSVLEELAILANNRGMLSKCSESQKAFPEVLVNSIMESISWDKICSLNELLQPIAEASPEVFLNCLESAIRESPEMIKHLREQESGGVFGQSYIQYIIWALEALAWDSEYLSNAASLLALLAGYYEESNNSGPLSSLTEIFLPWRYNTTANIEKRMSAMKILREENSDIAWKLLMNLFPNNHPSSFGTMHPVWMKEDSIENKGSVSSSEYWEQVNQYTALAVDMGKGDPAKIPDLIKQMNIMPQNAFDDLVEMISSIEMSSLSNSTKISIVNGLCHMFKMNKLNHDKEWALNPDNLKKINDLILQIELKDPHTIHVCLFSSEDYYLYGSEGFKKKREEIEHQRTDVVEKIINEEGIEGLIEFSNEVGLPEVLGHILGLIDEEYYGSILPSKMNSCNCDFIKGYITGRFEKRGCGWGVFQDIDSWDSENKVHFLYLLPFTLEVLPYVRKLNSGESESYWKNVNINPFKLNQETYGDVIKSLLGVGRFYTAIVTLSRLSDMEKDNCLKVDSDLIIKTLLLPPNLIEETPSIYVAFDVCELIKKVQSDDSIDAETKMSIEWRYLDLIDSSLGDIRPLTMEKQISKDPVLFCELVRMIYRSEKEEDKSVNKEQTSAIGAYKLLNLWKIPPGIDDDGNFDIDKFKSWFQTVKDISDKTGHIKVSMMTFGNVLMHIPPDEDGLWINKEVARILNDKRSDELRRGLYLGYVNSVGVYTPGNGFEERKAKEYRDRAQSAEEHGYRRLANCMKDVEEYFISLKKESDLHN